MLLANALKHHTLYISSLKLFFVIDYNFPVKNSIVLLITFHHYNVLKHNQIFFDLQLYEVIFLKKLLLKHKNIIIIGIGFSFQKCNKLPISKHDIKMKYILTEKGLI